MQIHNFLCDLLASTRILIDDYLFPHLPGLIKSYEFNLGNRTFQIGAEPSSAYALPAVIINIQDESINFGGRRSDLIQQNNYPNINKIPVLFNSENQMTVHVHEEQSIVSFTIAINCESQMQAKEIVYHIKKILPLYKNVNVFKFTTFLEISNNILFDVLNYDIVLSEIENLYTKFNSNTGNIEYCFSLEHNPLVRLDSATTSISDSSQSTFQVSLDLAYVIQFPQHLIIEEYNKIESINFSWNIDRLPIVMIPFGNVFYGKEPNIKVDRTLILDSEDLLYPSGTKISKTDTQVFISIQFYETDFIIDTDKYKFKFRKTVNGFREARDLVPEFIYPSDNKIVFVLSLEEYISLGLEPSSSDPLFVDFYYEK